MKKKTKRKKNRMPAGLRKYWAAAKRKANGKRRKAKGRKPNARRAHARKPARRKSAKRANPRKAKRVFVGDRKVAAGVARALKALGYSAKVVTRTKKRAK